MGQVTWWMKRTHESCRFHDRDHAINCVRRAHNWIVCCPLPTFRCHEYANFSTTFGGILIFRRPVPTMPSIIIIIIILRFTCFLLGSFCLVHCLCWIWCWPIVMSDTWHESPPPGKMTKFNCFRAKNVNWTGDEWQRKFSCSFMDYRTQHQKLSATDIVRSALKNVLCRQ